MAYTVILPRDQAKALARIGPPYHGRIGAAIDALAHNPRPPGALPVVTQPGRLRIRVGDYRVIYVVNDGAQRVEVESITHRRDAYQ